MSEFEVPCSPGLCPMETLGVKGKLHPKWEFYSFGEGELGLFIKFFIPDMALTADGKKYTNIYIISHGATYQEAFNEANTVMSKYNYAGIPDANHAAFAIRQIEGA